MALAELISLLVYNSYSIVKISSRFHLLTG